MLHVAFLNIHCMDGAQPELLIIIQLNPFVNLTSCLGLQTIGFSGLWQAQPGVLVPCANEGAGQQMQLFRFSPPWYTAVIIASYKYIVIYIYI